ncbi:flavin reductase family protein [Rhodococcus opacus]|uniref:flavin reductase family protein n=1 Tax=Rhodococcus opacus TaxID=37919 RepID=UPI001C461DF6|nr:flavin reductase family protein [Rhodococcus opacus]MBV6760439.1 flavin reductase family protein [Rhodococcus opacus]
MTTTITREQFVTTMGSVCTPVSIVATYGEDGAPSGSTVSAFLSLSADPPMILVSLSRTSRVLNVIQRAGGFSVNVLGSQAKELAITFASKADDRFEHVDWSHTPHGPRLNLASSWVGCELLESTAGGDHVILQGLIRAAHQGDSNPLIYHNRSFGTFSQLHP